MAKRENNTTMQSEIFIVMMIVMVLLFIITSLYLSKAKEHQQAPLIVLNEARGYSFGSSSSKLNTHFKAKLQASVVQQIIDLAKIHKCDIVEVYGYTDGQAFSKDTQGSSNFDKKLHLCLTVGCDIDNIESSSNLELGMQRAVSVVDFFKPYLINKKSPIKIVRPYSAGQFIDEKGSIANEEDTKRNNARRRIEIRLSRSKDLQ